jgi:hypothetical protein
MKTTSLLTLVSLAVLATQASAASAQSEAPVVVLPTYVVQVPLTQPAEQKVNASLNELRQQARMTNFTPVTMPLFKIAPLRPHLAVLDAKATRVAKL